MSPDPGVKAVINVNCFADIYACTFVGNQAQTFGGATCWIESSMSFENCTFHENAAANGAGVYVGDYAYVTMMNAIIAFSPSGGAFRCSGSSGGPYLSCCDIYGNTGGDYADCIASFAGTYGNISENPLFCLSQNPEMPYGLREDSPCAEENYPECGQIGAWPVGCEAGSDVEEDVPSTDALFLASPAPNPFRGEVRISYGVPQELENKRVDLVVFDATGRRVRTLVDRVERAGVRTVSWDGTDAQGAAVAGGVYFYQLRVGGEVMTKRVTVIR